MMNAQSFLEKLRADRERRLAKNKLSASGESKEFLLTENLAEGSKLWWPTEDTEVMLHILPFIVSKKDNIAEEEVGHFSVVRKVKLHYLPNKTHKVCPETYGHACPLCEKYRSYDKEERQKKNSPATKYKAKEFAIFNALFRVPGKDGKNRLEVRVVRGGAFAGWENIMKEIKGEAAIKANAPYMDKIFMYDDLIDGYWMNIRCNKASIAGGGASASFMQFTRINLLWKETQAPIPEAVISRITDLDFLIPPPATAEELKKSFDIKDIEVTEEEEEEFASIDSAIDEGDGISYTSSTTEEEELETLEEEVTELPDDVMGEEEPQPEPEPEPEPKPEPKKAVVKRKEAVKAKPEPEPVPEVKEEIIDTDTVSGSEDEEDDPFSDDEFDL